MSQGITGKFHINQTVHFRTRIRDARITACYGILHQYDYEISYLGSFGEITLDVLETEIHETNPPLYPGGPPEG